MSTDIATYRINYDVEQWRLQTDNGMVNVLPFGAALAVHHLCNEYERLTAELAQAKDLAPVSPMDWPLPCDVTVGAGTNCKGTPLSALVLRMKVLHGMAMKGQFVPAHLSMSQAGAGPDGHGYVHGWNDCVDSMLASTAARELPEIAKLCNLHIPMPNPGRAK